MAKNASAGHQLGQLVGDWFEEYIVWPLLQRVAEHLNLYLDTRFRARTARGEKLLWEDEDGNAVDFDFVLEMGGTDAETGAPVAFIESFWRRGSRHSKDKARDDSGKLGPMRDAYPAARFLGVIASGDFTEPARDLLRSRGIDLLLIPKSKIIEAFDDAGINIDYPDSAKEAAKAKLANAAAKKFTKKRKRQIAEKLVELVGNDTLDGYVDRVRAALRALPQEVRIWARRDSEAAVFDRIQEATAFLENPQFTFDDPTESFVYQCMFSDGSEFEGRGDSLADIRKLHGAIERLAAHVAKLPKE